HATVSLAWNWVNGPIKTLAPRGKRSQKSRSLKQACVTLHRPPPEILTLARNSGPFSKIEISSAPPASAKASAAKKPAAPPPTITTRREFIPATIRITRPVDKPRRFVAQAFQPAGSRDFPVPSSGFKQLAT